MAVASCLLDTNILLRLTRSTDTQHKLIETALSQLLLQEATLHYTHQNIAELWNVMTRHIERNGLGLTSKEAQREVQAIESGMTLCPTVKRSIGSGEGVSFSTTFWEFGSTMAATMYVHDVKPILTLNPSDFSRFDELIVLHPAYL